MNSNLSIKDLENISGVKAHTIRIWEKRYRLIKPERTPTNIRFYDNTDLKKLLNISSLISKGMKISKAAMLSSEKLHEAIENLQKNDSVNSEKLLVNDLIIATLNCDVFSFEKYYSGYRKKHGFEATVEKILYPLLVRIGLLWSVNKMNIGQEHFASQLVRKKLFAAINALPHKASDNKYLLYLPEKQHHEIGLLYAHYLILKKGNQSVYLGPNVPLSYVKSCSETIKATHILCSFIIPIAKDKMLVYLDKMNDYFKDGQVIIHNNKKDKLDIGKRPSMSLISSIDDLKKMI